MFSNCRSHSGVYEDQESESKTEKTGKKQANREKETGGEYLQGRGGGTPMSAKSGSEERAEERCIFVVTERQNLQRGNKSRL